MFADLKNDFVFRRIFAHHPTLTQALLNDLLGLEGPRRIASLRLLSPEQAPVVAGSKLSILDLKAKDESGRTFVVEIQLLHVSGFLNRIVYNACKTYVAQLPAGGAYSTLHDVVALSICNFELWPVEPSKPTVPLVSLWSMREAISGIEGLGQVQYAFVELPKVSEGRAPATAAETWAWLFRDAALLDAMPRGLSEAQEDAMHLAEEATFSLEEAEAYRRVNDEIAQAEQLGNDREARGEARGDARGEVRGLRAAVADLCEVLGIQLTAASRAEIEGLDGAGLTALRERIKAARGWGGSLRKGARQRVLAKGREPVQLVRRNGGRVRKDGLRTRGASWHRWSWGPPRSHASRTPTRRARRPSRSAL